MYIYILHKLLEIDVYLILGRSGTYKYCRFLTEDKHCNSKREYSFSLLLLISLLYVL